jgi:hypothetical protein
MIGSLNFGPVGLELEETHIPLIFLIGNNMSIFIFPYNQHSQSVRNLGFLRIKRDNSRYRYSDRHTLINWGCSPGQHHVLDETPWHDVVNHPDVVHHAKNKLTCFQALQAQEFNNYVIPWTTDQQQVRQWLDERHTVFARTTLTGHSGAGIIELSGSGSPIPDAPLYTKYIQKKAEFRVHVVDETSIFVTQKVARPGAEVTNWHVRSHQNGFIFQEPSRNLPTGLIDRLESLAGSAIDLLDLDFGAVDIIWNSKSDRLYFLEVNTAPGITGRTVDFYRNAFESL